MRRCKICDDWVYAGRHICQPIWMVREVDFDEDEAIEIHASSASGAAEEFARRHDSEDYYLAENNTDMDVIVTRDGASEMFNITGYFDPVYAATPVSYAGGGE